MKRIPKNRSLYLLVAVIMVVAMLFSMVGSITLRPQKSLTAAEAGATEASISTNKTKYAVGEQMVISGIGFTPGGTVDMSVLRPDKAVEAWAVAADATGAFSTLYTPTPPAPGRFKITATDGVNAGMTAATEADAIGYGKAVYNKYDTTYAGGAGHWTTGNAGSNYLENQWAFYQYQITGVTAGNVPSFDVVFNHFQSSSGAIFIDAFSNFRAVLDAPVATTNQSGPMEGLLLDGIPYPPVGDTDWLEGLVTGGAITKINYAYVGGVLTNFDASNSPSAEHGFHVNGTVLGTLVNVPPTGTHTITIFYEAHLASTAVWHTGNEGKLGDPLSIYYVHPGPEVLPLNTVYGTEAYTGWTTLFLGVGSATGSSRHFYIENQTAGSKGGLTLPIPTVPAANASITVIKNTIPDGPQDFGFSTTGGLNPSTFSLDDDSDATLSNMQVFTGLSAGTYTVTEGAVAGFSLTSIVGATSSDLGTRTATITLATGGTATVTFTNTQMGKIIVDKVTDPTSSQLFEFNPSWSETNFFLADATTPYDSGWLVPGNYTVTETVPEGWTLTGITKEAVAFTNGGTIALGAGETVHIVFTDTQKGKIIVDKVTDPSLSPQSFTFTPTGTGYTTPFDLTDAATPNDSGWLVPGNYTVTETVPEGWTLTGITKEAVAFTNGGTIALGAGETVHIVFTDTQKGHVTVIKTESTAGGTPGAPITQYTFNLSGGPDSVNITKTTGVDDDPVGSGNLDFGLLKPGSYTLTELAVPAGTHSTLQDLGGTVDPNTGNISLSFTLSAGQEKTFNIDNSRPGGGTRTIGYWKNWNSYSHDGAFVARAAKTGNHLADEYLPILIGDLSVDSAKIAWEILSKTALDNTKNSANDAAYALAAQLLAAKLNVAAGAAVPGWASTAITQAQTLLANADFNGTGEYWKGGKNASANRATALNLANILDHYNNGTTP
jgi:hypothetical protein